MELPPNPNNNPHLRNELERGKEAPVRFEAGLSGNTVKAARLESSAGEAAWRAMREWSYPMVLAPQLHTADEAVRLPTKDSTRPPRVRSAWNGDHAGRTDRYQTYNSILQTRRVTDDPGDEAHWDYDTVPTGTWRVTQTSRIGLRDSCFLQ